MPVFQGVSPEELALLPHDDRSHTLLAVHWALTTIATVFLALRVYCKFYTKKNLWWDDWILIAAWFMILATDILTTILAKEFGMGRHSYDLNIYDPVTFMLVLSTRATTTLTALAWTKTAFAVTLLRLTTDKTKAFVWCIIISLTIAMGFSAAVPWIQCQPLAKGWDVELPGTCWAPQVGTKIWIGTGALSAAMDFTLAALPWTFLYHTTLRKKEKIGILIAMSMGVVAGVVAIIKCIKLPHLGEDPYRDVELFDWDIAESTVTMMAACIPTLRVLLRDTKISSTSAERSTGLSRFSFSFMSNRRRRDFDSDTEVVHETMISKNETQNGGSASGESASGGRASGGRASGGGSGTHHAYGLDAS